MKKTSLNKITFTAMLSALALIAFMLENLLPPLVLPGARLGLSHVFILLAVIVIGNGYGYAVFIVKVTLGSIFAGNVSSLIYSLPAGAVALTSEIFLLNFYRKFGVISVSIFGGSINLLLQNVMFSLTTGVSEYLAYAPYLALLGMISGAIVGTIVYLTDKKLPARIKERFTE